MASNVRTTPVRTEVAATQKSAATEPQTRTPIVPQRPSNGEHRLGTVPDEVARLIRGAFVVVVSTPTGTHRRRVFLTVKAAEAAARRATDRGQVAEVVLAELRPVWHVTASDEAVPGGVR